MRNSFGRIQTTTIGTVATLGLLLQAVGCAETQPTIASANARLTLSVTTDLNVTYRLRDAIFDVSGPQNMTLSSEGYGLDEDAIEVTLPVGDYQMLLAGNWYLEYSATDHPWTTIDAQLVSDNPTSVAITANQTASVTLLFEVDGETVTFGGGNLNVGIEVEEVSNDCGDGIKDEGEECDDGSNGDNCDGCLDNCTTHTNVCGDNYECGGEECDDGAMAAAAVADPALPLPEANGGYGDYDDQIPLEYGYGMDLWWPWFVKDAYPDECTRCDPYLATRDITPWFNPTPFDFFTWSWHTWVSRNIKMSRVPLHGVGHIPNGTPPVDGFPLVLVVHGMSLPNQRSYRGYKYLTEHLASHGMIAISVEEDFLNSWKPVGEIDARAMVLLYHIEFILKSIDDDELATDHPLWALKGKVNRERIALVGHSRGGEAAGIANSYIEDGDFGFGLSSVFAIAPTDQRATDGDADYLDGVDYFVMHGSHDSDVHSFEGMATYDRAYSEQILSQSLEGSGRKGAVFLHGANHNQWNTVWPNPLAWRRARSPIYPLLGEQQQMEIGKSFITAWFSTTLKDNSNDGYMPLFAGTKAGLDPNVFSAFFSLGHSGDFRDIQMNQQYQDVRRIFVDHFDEDDQLRTASLQNGTNEYTASDGTFWQETPLGVVYGEAGCPGALDGLLLTWDHDSQDTPFQYRITMPSTLDQELDDLDLLSFRAGQVYEGVLLNLSLLDRINYGKLVLDDDGNVQYTGEPHFNTFGQSQDFSVRLKVNGVETNAVVVSELRDLSFPMPVVSRLSYRLLTERRDVTKTIADTVRIPLRAFGCGEIYAADVEEIILEFGETDKGKVVVDDIQFTKAFAFELRE